MMSMWTWEKRPSGAMNWEGTTLTCRAIFDCWQSMQFLQARFISLCMLGQTKYWRISLSVILALGWEVAWYRSNTHSRSDLGKYGLRDSSPMSQYIGVWFGPHVSFFNDRERSDDLRLLASSWSCSCALESSLKSNCVEKRIASIRDNVRYAVYCLYRRDIQSLWRTELYMIIVETDAMTTDRSSWWTHKLRACGQCKS